MEEFLETSPACEQQTITHATKLGEMLKQTKNKTNKSNKKVPLSNHFFPFHHAGIKDGKLYFFLAKQKEQ